MRDVYAITMVIIMEMTSEDFIITIMFTFYSRFVVCLLVLVLMGFC